VKYLAILIVILSLAGCANLTPYQNEAIYQGINVTDGIITSYGIERGCTEGNWLVPTKPDNTQIATFVVVRGLIHYGITRWARSISPSDELAWQRMSSSVTGAGVGWNAYEVGKCN
jgi:hypothetical protein